MRKHVAKSVSYQAALQGNDVRYVEADTEFALWSTTVYDCKKIQK